MTTHQSEREVPKPKVGLRVIDTSCPGAPWKVIQYDDMWSPIYIQRERDGRIFHHTHESWAAAWRRGYLDRA